MRAFFWVTSIIFILDQITKYLVVHVLGMEEGQVMPVLSPILELRMVYNKGINFGLFGGLDLRWWLIVLSLVISVAVTIWLWRTAQTKWHYVAGGLLVGGALGNVIDRVIYPGVADFLNMSCCGINNPYAFNIADIAIFAGALGLAFLPDAKPKKR